MAELRYQVRAAPFLPLPCHLKIGTNRGWLSFKSPPLTTQNRDIFLLWSPRRHEATSAAEGNTVSSTSLILQANVPLKGVADRCSGPGRAMGPACVCCLHAMTRELRHRGSVTLVHQFSLRHPESTSIASSSRCSPASCTSMAWRTGSVQRSLCRRIVHTESGRSHQAWWQ